MAWPTLPAVPGAVSCLRVARRPVRIVRKLLATTASVTGAAIDAVVALPKQTPSRSSTVAASLYAAVYSNANDAEMPATTATPALGHSSSSGSRCGSPGANGTLILTSTATCDSTVSSGSSSSSAAAAASASASSTSSSLSLLPDSYQHQRKFSPPRSTALYDDDKCGDPDAGPSTSAPPRSRSPPSGERSGWLGAGMWQALGDRLCMQCSSLQRRLQYEVGGCENYVVLCSLRECRRKTCVWCEWFRKGALAVVVLRLRGRVICVRVCVRSSAFACC